MSIIGTILTIERTLPTEVLAGVLSGQYSIHGGVVRGTTGQIVRHLVPAATSATASVLNPFGMVNSVFSVFNTYQLHRLTAMAEQIMAIGAATMAMSGLNLAVSAFGFLSISNSLKQVQKHLAGLKDDGHWIRDFLDTGRTARLLHAADELSVLPQDLESRTDILRRQRDALGEVAMHYLQHWDQSEKLPEKMAYQHYYCVAFLAKSRCSAELGLHENAISEFQSGIDNWRERSRKLALDTLLGENPSRFLDHRHAKAIPIAKIAGWMDFAREAEQGFAWIDELRSDFDPSIWDRFKKDDETENTRFLDNLVSRNEVLEGYRSQYRFLAENRVTPTQFQEEIKALPKESATDGLLILAPIEIEQVKALETT